MNEILNLLSLLFAAVAAVAAVIAIFLTRKSLSLSERTILQAEHARELVEKDRRDAEVDRCAAQNDRRWHRLVEIGETVEDVYWLAEVADAGAKENGRELDQRWKASRNRLRHLLVGMGEALPACADLVGAYGPEEAIGRASLARAEIQSALRDVSPSPEPATSIR